MAAANDEAPTGQTVRGPKDQDNERRNDAMPAVIAKRFATLQAELALRGFEVMRSSGDDGGPLYIVTRWALTKQCRDLAELEAFAATVAPEIAG